ncbi:5907_t:CDS:2 [Entrophospora sp. SA101]|nr:5907_t:CDS:2 [Entrophospora sp. SA101]
MYLVDDYQKRLPNTTSLSDALKYDYILCFGISYTEQSSKWFCIPDSSKLPESELINSLMIHTYDIDLQNNLHENRKMDTVKLVDFVSQDLKSLPDYLQAITPFVELSELQEYLNKYAIPVPADFPGQYYVCKAITLKRLYGDDIDIPNQILHLVPFLGPLHDLSIGYHTKSPPNLNIFCGAKDHDINIEIDQLQLYEKVLIRGHWYHNECIQKMDFKCHYCLNYLVDGINVLSSTYNDRLESQFSNDNFLKNKLEPVPEPLMDTSEN